MVEWCSGVLSHGPNVYPFLPTMNFNDDIIHIMTRIILLVLLVAFASERVSSGEFVYL